MPTVEGVGQPVKRVGKEEAMDAREDTVRQSSGRRLLAHFGPQLIESPATLSVPAPCTEKAGAVSLTFATYSHLLSKRHCLTLVIVRSER
jgi:hypothetical protein